MVFRRRQCNTNGKMAIETVCFVKLYLPISLMFFLMNTAARSKFLSSLNAFTARWRRNIILKFTGNLSQWYKLWFAWYFSLATFNSTHRPTGPRKQNLQRNEQISVKRRGAHGHGHFTFNTNLGWLFFCQFFLSFGLIPNV